MNDSSQAVTQDGADARSARQDDGPPVLAVDADGVATIRLNRPGQHNRIAPEDCETLSAYLTQLSALPQVRLLCLTGTGARTFSSGYTLQAILTQLDDRFERMLDQLEAFPAPSVCLLNGSVYGGATDLALCCDVRVGVQGMRMLMPASRIGLHYYPGGIRRYVQNLGMSHAKRLFLTAQEVSDQDMLRMGFLHSLVPAQALDEHWQGLRASLLACALPVQKSMKADVHAVAAGDADMQALQDHYQASLASDDLRQRLAAMGR